MRNVYVNQGTRIFWGRLYCQFASCEFGELWVWELWVYELRICELRVCELRVCESAIWAVVSVTAITINVLCLGGNFEALHMELIGRGQLYCELRVCELRVCELRVGLSWVLQLHVDFHLLCIYLYVKRKIRNWMWFKSCIYA